LSKRDADKGKKEILFYYESRQNPNGDPGFENQPRIMPDGTLMVTDVRIKRTMRDYAKKAWNETLFVDFGENGNPITADKRAIEIFKKNGRTKITKLDEGEDNIRSLLKTTFDVPLFGALLTLRPENGDGGGGSAQKLTGPLQFGTGRSINKVQIINPQISTRFVGKVKKKQDLQFSTLGRFYSVEYALIKVHGALNPANLEKYLDDSEIKAKFTECSNRIFDCLWNGTNELVTRSKFPQRSIFYLEITYTDTIYNDLPNLVDENEDLKKTVSTLGISPFNFEKLISALKQRKDKVKKVRVYGCAEISSDVKDLVSQINSKVKGGLVEEIAA
jgi:CRISPR-associated protein Csh2